MFFSMDIDSIREKCNSDSQWCCSYGDLFCLELGLASSNSQIIEIPRVGTRETRWVFTKGQTKCTIVKSKDYFYILIPWREYPKTSFFSMDINSTGKNKTGIITFPIILYLFLYEKAEWRFLFNAYQHHFTGYLRS